MAGKSPTQKTLGFFKALGCKAAVVEHWNPFAKIRQDLFGFADVLALGEHIVAVQTTTQNHHSDRRKKIEGLEAAKSFLAAGGKIILMTWKPGTKPDGMLPRVEEATLEAWGDVKWIEHHGRSFDWILTAPF